MAYGADSGSGKDRWKKRSQIGLALNVPRDVRPELWQPRHYQAVCRGSTTRHMNTCMESLHLCESIGDDVGIGRSYANLGINAYEQGDYEAAQEYYKRSIALQREAGDQQGIALNQEQYRSDPRAGGARQTRRAAILRVGWQSPGSINHRYAVAARIEPFGG